MEPSGVNSIFLMDSFVQYFQFVLLCGVIHFQVFPVCVPPCMHVSMHAKSLQLCLHLCSPMGCSPPGSCVHEILQARIQEWGAMPASRGSSRPRDWACVSYVPCIEGGFFTPCATWEAPRMNRSQLIYSFYSLWEVSSFQVGDNYKLVLLWTSQNVSFCKHTYTFCWLSAWGWNCGVVGYVHIQLF